MGNAASGYGMQIFVADPTKCYTSPCWSHFIELEETARTRYMTSGPCSSLNSIERLLYQRCPFELIVLTLFRASIPCRPLATRPALTVNVLDCGIQG